MGSSTSQETRSKSPPRSVSDAAEANIGESLATAAAGADENSGNHAQPRSLLEQLREQLTDPSSIWSHVPADIFHQMAPFLHPAPELILQLSNRRALRSIRLTPSAPLSVDDSLPQLPMRVETVKRIKCATLDGCFVAAGAVQSSVRQVRRKRKFLTQNCPLRRRLVRHLSHERGVHV